MAEHHDEVAVVSNHHGHNHHHHHSHHHHDDEKIDGFEAEAGLTVEATSADRNGDDDAIHRDGEHDHHISKAIGTTLSPPLSNDEERTPSPTAVIDGKVLEQANHDHHHDHHQHNDGNEERRIEVIEVEPVSDPSLLPPPAALLIAAANSSVDSSALTPTSEDIITEETDWPIAPINSENTETTEHSEHHSVEHHHEPVEPVEVFVEKLDEEIAVYQPEAPAEPPKLEEEIAAEVPDEELVAEQPVEIDLEPVIVIEEPVVEVVSDEQVEIALLAEEQTPVDVPVYEELPLPTPPPPPSASPALLLASGGDEDAPQAPKRHRRTPSMPVNVITLDSNDLAPTSASNDEATPTAPRRHKKTASLIQVVARIEHSPDDYRRSKTAEPTFITDELAPKAPERHRKATPSIVIDKPEPPLEPEVKVAPPEIQPENHQVVVPKLEISPVTNDENQPVATYQTLEQPEEPHVVVASSLPDGGHVKKVAEGEQAASSLTLTPISPRSDDSSTLVTQEQLVAELKDVLRKKNRYVEVVPDSVRFQRGGNSSGSGGLSDAESDHVTIVTEQPTSSSLADAAAANDSNNIINNNLNSSSMSSSSAPRRLIEIVLVGDSSVPKAALCQLLAGGQQDSSIDSTKPFSYNCVVDGTEVALLIHNTSGRKDDSATLLNESYKKADVIVGCFSQNNAQSLESLRKHWLPEVRRVKPGIPVVLAAERHQHDQHLDDSENETSDSSTETTNSTSMTLSECQAAARAMGAATLVEYSSSSPSHHHNHHSHHPSHHPTEKPDGEAANNEEAPSSPSDDKATATASHELQARQIFEAAVHAYNAAAIEQLNKQHSQQPLTAAEAEKRKRCCTIL